MREKSLPFFVVFLLTASVANKRAMIKNISAWKITSLNEYSVQIRLGSNLGGFFYFRKKEDDYGRKSGSDQAVFTPNDANNYNTVTRTITVKVTKATPVIAEKRRFN